MKRGLIIFLVVLYSVASIGATVTTHFCAGTVKKCKCAKAAKKDLCCSEKTVYLKSQDSHQTQPSANNFVKKVSLPIVPIIYSIDTKSFFVLQNNTIISSKAMVYTGPPLFKFICLYLI